MSYIAPSSDVYLLKGVHLDSGYNHTIWFENATSQQQYFQSFVKPSQSGTSFHLTNLTYQRVNKGIIRVGIKADLLYDVNYMMFKNTAHGNKWFYAFVDSIDYINDNASELHYTIDVMQTWAFDYELGECFVERQHNETDDIGDNIVEENINTGELICQQKDEYIFNINPTPLPPLGYTFDMVILYVPNQTNSLRKLVTISGVGDDGRYTYASTPSNTRGIIINGQYAGVDILPIPFRLGTNIDITSDNIGNAIDAIIAAQGNVVQLIEVPDAMLTGFTTQGVFSDNKTIYKLTSFKSAILGKEAYTPKNKKLFTAPFVKLVVSNNLGQTQELDFEKASQPNIGIRFNLEGTPLTNPELCCYPKNYRGIDKDYESGLLITDFPTASWSEDSFAKWWATNKEAFITSTISSAVAGVAAIGATVATGGAAAAVIGGSTAALIGARTAAGAATGGVSVVSGIANSIGTYKTQKNTPDNICGEVNNSALRILQGRIGYYFYTMGMKAEYAKVVDDYFTMFGYAQNVVKTPNLHARKRYTYIKTNGIIIHAKTQSGTIVGGLPADDENAIAKIFENGITFWAKTSTVTPDIGNYTDPNPTL